MAIAVVNYGRKAVNTPMEYRLLVNLSIPTLNLYGSNSPLPVSVSIFANSLQTLYNAARISEQARPTSSRISRAGTKIIHSSSGLGTLSMAIATLDPTGFQIYADV
ncbi:MAG: hypothetical protein AAGI69_07930 [Cyanobacteria bacterium P01_H01_bin.21]